MKANLSAFLFSMLLISIAHAQDFPGYRTGNYNGVNALFSNPANIADSRYRFDFNLFSVSVGAANDKATFSLKKIGDTFDSDSIKNKIFGENAGKSNGFASAVVLGPSLMFNAGKKMAIGLSTKARVMANVVDLDGKLADKISDGFTNDPSLPYTIASSGNMRLNVNAWTEYGLTIARVISDKGKHFFKAGATFKYLAGAGNAYVNLANLNGTLNKDDATQNNYLQNTRGQVALGFGGVSLTDIDLDEATKMESRGFGADVGFVYEYRPQHEKYRAEDGKGWNREANKYKWKIGVSLMDVGSIKYDKDIQRSGAYTADITGNERFYLNELEELDIDEYNAYLKTKPQYFTPSNTNNESSYSVALPATLQVNVDYHLHKGFYFNLASQVSLAGSGDKPYNSGYYSSFTLTPRFEGKAVGLYLPINYNKISDLNVGAALRLGPLFIGSGSVLTSLLGDSKQADVFFGLRFGGMQRK